MDECRLSRDLLWILSMAKRLNRINAGLLEVVAMAAFDLFLVS